MGTGDATGGGDFARPAELPVCCWRIGNEKPSMLGGNPATGRRVLTKGIGMRGQIACTHALTKVPRRPVHRVEHAP